MSTLLAQRLLAATRRRLSARCLAVAVAAVALFAAAAPIAWQLDGRTGMLAAGVAAGICLAATLLSLLIEEPFRGGQAMFTGVLLGMLCRMGLPIAAALVIKLRSQTLLEAGAAVYLLLFFLVCLAAHAVVSLSPAQPSD